MGLSSNFGEFGALLDRAGRTMHVGMDVALVAGGEALATVIRGEINAVAPGGRMRGLGRSGAKVGVRVEKVPGGVVVRSAGALHLLERNTAPHQIRVRRARALRLGGDAYAVSVKHPGSKGKHPFERGAIAGTPLALGVVRQVLADELLKAAL